MKSALLAVSLCLAGCHQSSDNMVIESWARFQRQAAANAERASQHFRSRTSIDTASFMITWKTSDLRVVSSGPDIENRYLAIIELSVEIDERDAGTARIQDYRLLFRPVISGRRVTWKHVSGTVTVDGKSGDFSLDDDPPEIRVLFAHVEQ